MATPTFPRGAEPLVLATAEAYPKHSYTQQEFLDAFLEVRARATRPPLAA